MHHAKTPGLPRTLALVSSGMMDPLRVPIIGKYIPTVASKTQKAQNRIARVSLIALVTSAKAATRQVILAKLALCLIAEPAASVEIP